MANNQTFTLNIKALFDASDVKAKVGDIQNILSKLKLPDNLKTSFKTAFTDLNKEIDNYQRIMQNGFKTKGDVSSLEKSGNNIIRLYDDIVKKINSIDNTALKKAFEDAGAKEVEKLRQQLDGLQNDLKSKISGQKIIDFSSTKAELKNLTSQFTEAGNKINSTFKTLSGSTINTLFKNIEAGRFDLAANNLEKIKQQVDSLNNADLTNWFTNLQTKFNQLAGDGGIKGTADQIAQLKQELATVEAATIQKLINDFNTGKINAQEFQSILRETVSTTQDWANAQAQTNREIDQVKSRIQYFLSLNNAINLIKRAIRGAVDTVKELDKAMTETAVVTSNTISDMWQKLPDYTKRANELGVSTLEAYKAATLYYQQGLNDDQAAALSTETLKMARIAGLEAADATDRMTNALRGFNMELNEVSAQKVDDVYSQLAAMSASNVDEISTAMTKVASLAHSANMEFETTAAFLAQIIETTRESAETAGTALKTVVARFSEVKKLYDMDELKGKDEEGQSIDVNKVSSALRTAGIDLNKYFLGEVGLDDIFMELASKWDNLTSVQQRYIATQAAGSRQQSRFIALMQDYARTQQLVSAAYNANGASAKQFEKTQESLQSKLARLKNAWDQFLMGLANNTVIKMAVDLLTGLLNIVNSLTEAFGTGAGSILKWVAAVSAFKGIRSLVGLAATSMVGAAGAAGAAGATNTAGAVGSLLPKIFGVGKEGAKRTSIIFGSGSLLAQAGKGLWSGAQNLGTRATFLPGLVGKATGGMASGLEGLGATHGLAAGLTGIATALTAVTAAVVAAVAIYKAWEKFSPEGQLKTAKKEAEKANKEAQKAQEDYKKLNSLQDTYKEKTEEVNNATNTRDRQVAIEDRNQAILDAIKEDGTLAQYVVTEQVGFDIVLTIDEEALEKATKDQAEAARQAQIESGFATADEQRAQSNVYQDQLRSIWIRATGQSRRDVEGYNLSAEQYLKQILASTTNESDRSRAAELYNLYSGATNSAQKQAELTYGQVLSSFNLDAELTNKLLPMFGELFTETGKRLDVTAISNLLGMGKGSLTPLLEAWAGTGKVAELTLNDPSIDIDSDEFLTDTLGLTKDKLEEFANYLGVDINTVKNHIRAQAKANKEIQKQNQATIFQSALSSGIKINKDVFTDVKTMKPQIAAQVAEISNAAQEAMSKEGFKSLMEQMISGSLNTNQLQEIQSFYNNFNLDNPIQAFHQLKQAQDEVASRANTDPFKGMLASIDEANKKIFDTGNLVQTFITSANYDSLTDSLENFIKENGRITSNNIEELADSCSDLQILLEDTTVTAQGLAEAFTQFENGSLAIDSITSSLLSALSAGESFEGLIDNVSKWIKDFNEGTDLKTGTEHIVSSLDDLYKYVDNWEFGNEPTENIFNHIFGDKAYETKLKQFVNDTKTDFVGLENSLKGDIERIKGWAENEGLGGIQQALSKGVTGLSQIEGEGGLFFDWDLSQFDTTAQAINEVSKALNVGKDTAEAFIMSWQTHIPYLRTEWNNLNFKEAINAFVTDLGNSRTITEQELDALSAKYGKEVDEIINEINRLRTAAGEDIIVRVNWKDGKGQNLTGDALINQFNQAAEQAGDIQSTTRYNGRDLETKYDYSKIGEEFSKTFNNVVGPNGILQNGIDAIDFSALSEHLVDAYKLSPQQANEVANNIVKSTDGKFAQTIKVPIEAQDGSIEMMEKTVIADSAEGLSAAVNAELEAADMTILAGKLANLDVESVGSRLSDALITAGSTGAASIQSDLNGIKVNTIQVPVDWYWVNSPPSGGSGNTNPVTGGIVGSYAGGSEHFHVNPGTSLTGEEGPEIVWNKDGKYAYITGQNGPEFADLHPGDRVFNAAETRRILRNSNASGGLIDSYASGGWKPPASSSKSGGGSSGGSGKGSSGKDKTPEEWKNDLDWLYNLMEDIAELERDQKAIEEQYEDLLQDQTKTGGDLYRLLVKQLGNLYTQLNHQTFALEKREQEMREFMDITNDKDEYLWYNWQDRTIEIDWDAIDQITDEDEYKHVKELIDEAEEIQDKIDDADDAIMDITNQIQELENIWRDTFVDFEDRVLDAIIKSYQQIIDNYSELNDTLNNSNTQILDSLQKQISLERQIRDNTKTEEEISDEEARLAYLRRDTSGGNELAALQLEKELADQRENYEDTLVDQAISRLQEDNDAAAQQRERQIEIMQAQLDYQSENGEFNAYISELLTTAMGADGELLTNSDLVTLLKEQENWNAMSAVSKEVWDEELNGTFKEVAAFLLKQNAEENGTFYTALTKAVEGVSSAIGSYSQAMTKLGNQIASAGSSGDGGSSGGNYNPNTTPPPKSPQSISVGTVTGGANATLTTVAKAAETASRGYGTIAGYANQILRPSSGGSIRLPNGKTYKYATGGLADSTGLAWLDGTPSEPEYVLNARQTDAFLKLADVLPSMMNGMSTTTSNTFGATYVNLSVNLESVSPDYDVDRMVDLVKDKLYDAGSYRNVNSLSFLR